MRIIHAAADRLLGRLVPRALAFGGDTRCPCNDCYCSTSHTWCCTNCDCSVVRCYGYCSG